MVSKALAEKGSHVRLSDSRITNQHNLQMSACNSLPECIGLPWTGSRNSKIRLPLCSSLFEDRYLREIDIGLDLLVFLCTTSSLNIGCVKWPMFVVGLSWWLEISWSLCITEREYRGEIWGDIVLGGYSCKARDAARESKDNERKQFT